MPGKDGFTILEEMRGNPPTNNIPVIVATSNDQEDVQIHVFNLGAEDGRKPKIHMRSWLRE